MFNDGSFFSSDKFVQCVYKVGVTLLAGESDFMNYLECIAM